ncbi:hypothetical protein PSEUDO8Z_90018 [Pseudomonas sp. 8Z]|nr:hypothetical protein PSEUDO8Z_90018 [Pseudomonas sp. 8Z]
MRPQRLGTRRSPDAIRGWFRTDFPDYIWATHRRIFADCVTDVGGFPLSDPWVIWLNPSIAGISGTGTASAKALSAARSFADAATIRTTRGQPMNCHAPCTLSQPLLLMGCHPTATAAVLVRCCTRRR